jgi:hypothetical protein
MSSDSIFSLSATEYFSLFFPRPSAFLKFVHNAYNYSLSVTCVNVSLSLLVLSVTDPIIFVTSRSLSGFPAFYLVFSTLLQFVWLFFSSFGMFLEIRRFFVRPRRLAALYMSVSLTFSLLYYTMLCFDRSAFLITGYESSDSLNEDCNDISCSTGIGSNHENVNDQLSLFVFCIYFGITAQTSTGFGDIAAADTKGRMAVDLQMALALLFHMGIFGLAMTHFQMKNKQQSKQKSQENSPESFQERMNEIPVDSSVALSLKNLLNENLSKLILLDAKLSENVNIHHDQIVHERFQSFFTRFSSFVHLSASYVDNPVFRSIRRFASHYILPTSMILQAIGVSFVWIMPNPFTPLGQLSGSEHTEKVLFICLFGLMLLLQFTLVLSVSVRLIGHINTNEVSISFLIQSYFSTALFYAMLYFLLYTGTPSHEFSINKNEDDSDIFQVVFLFTYFSFTAMSGTGFGDVYPRAALSRAVCTTEMIMSIFYQFVIVGLGLATLIDRQENDAVKIFADRFKAEKSKLECKLDVDKEKEVNGSNVDLSASNSS